MIFISLLETMDWRDELFGADAHLRRRGSTWCVRVVYASEYKKDTYREHKYRLKSFEVILAVFKEGIDIVYAQ
jgi:hypothetical protein